MKKAMCLVLIVMLLISILGCGENKNSGVINSQPDNTIGLDLIPPDAKSMFVSYYKNGKNSEKPEKTVYTATKDQLDDLRAELANTECIELSEKDLFSYSNAANINAWDIKIDFNKGESLYIYYEGAISRFITDKSSLPTPHSYYVSADSMYQFYKILYPDFEKDRITHTQDDKYIKLDDINPEQVQEIAFYLPSHQTIYEFGDGFISFNAVRKGVNKYFLRAIKYDENGNFIWVKNYTDIETLSYMRTSFVKMSDGGFAIALDGDITYSIENPGTSESKQIPNIRHGYLLKCDKDGNEVWGDILEFDGSGQVESLAENQNGEIITVGCFQMNDIVLMKYDKNGKRTIMRTFGGSDFESFVSAYYSPKAGLVINGSTQSCDGDITARKEQGTMLLIAVIVIL